MKLFLSSYDLGAVPATLSALCPNVRVGVIMNGLDAHPKRRVARWEDQSSSLRDIGLQVSELDLRRYFHAPDKISDALDVLDMVWVNGGDPFILRRAMAQSGFDKQITKCVTSQQIVYGGFSAGALVATPTLKGLNPGDEPDILPAGYQQDLIWDGLGLVPFSLIAHHTMTGPGSVESRQVRDYFMSEKIAFQTLEDGEALIIDGDFASMRKVGWPSPRDEEPRNECFRGSLSV